MAIVLKAPLGPSKGVVVFTHKERRFIDLDAPILGGELRRLRERYFVLMHWGWSSQDVPRLPAVDAHVCRESTVTFREPGVRRIPLNSAMFTPAYFRPQALHKHWDVISVTRALKAKRTGELLACLRILLDKRPDTTAMIVCGGSANLADPNMENDLYEQYTAMFSEAERDRVTLLLTRSAVPFPLPRRDIAFFYNSSRVFTLFSDVEGESRVIKEALICGLPVLVKRHLAGGGRDFLTDTNSRLFSTAQEGAERLLEMLEQPERFQIDAAAIADEIGEVANVPRFIAAIRALFDEAGVPFEGKLDTTDLSRKLPSHVSYLPVELRLPTSDDLRSTEAALCYVRAIMAGVPFDAIRVTPKERLIMRAFERSLTLRGYVDGARRRLQLA
jgi:glycosyltransferase involved in cell wall biosynthesis